MKFTKIITIISSLIITLSAFADAEIKKSSNEEIQKAQSIIDQHLMNCGSGQSGWWLKLDSGSYQTSATGGIYISNGQYYGCGTCASCHIKLNQDINAILAREEQFCKNRGGVVKAESTGTYSEDIRPTEWKMSSKDINITCEKWITCD